MATNITANEPDPFDAPSEGGFIGKETMKELKGELLIFMPLAYHPNKPTRNSKKGEDSPCVECNVLVVTGPREGELFERTPFWQVVLVKQMMDKIGSVIPGRLEQGEERDGKNAPWQIEKIDKETEKGAGDHALALKAYKAYKEQAARKEPDPFG
jgi:hypothetical protein